MDPAINKLSMTRTTFNEDSFSLDSRQKTEERLTKRNTLTLNIFIQT